MSVNYKTKQYYSSNHKTYIESTVNADMVDHYEHFCKYIEKGAKILDVGFGSGRDMLYFKNKGYTVFGIDNVEEFVNHARNLGLNVSNEDFHNLQYKNEFDGIWACASLLHSDNLLLAFKNLFNAVKNNGYIFISMKYGKGTAMKNGRFYQYVDEETIENICNKIGLQIIELYKSQDNLKREQSWINVILNKQVK